jgi:hypothetical protein
MKKQRNSESDTIVYKAIVGAVLLTKYYLGNRIEKDRMGGACSTYGKSRGVYRKLVGKSERRRPLGRPGRRWEDNINMDVH